MKLFTLGPVEMYERTKTIGALQNPYFRVPEFSIFMQETDMLLREFMNAPSDYHVVYLASSGTGAMEATLMNCFDASDKLLVINGGQFATYFTRLCDYQNLSYDCVEIPFGNTLTANDLFPFANKGYTALLVNIHETSTCQLYDIKVLKEFCIQNNMYLVVDAISSVCADEYDIQKYEIDVTIISSQKGFALSPGLAMVIMSPKIFEEKVKKHKILSLYFDFKEYVKNMTRYQTPYTPAIGILYQLNDMLKFLLKDGENNSAGYSKLLAEHFRKGVDRLAVSMPSYPLSNAATPFFFPNNAFSVHRILKDRYDILINPSAILPDVLCRVGHFGNLTLKDHDVLLIILEQVLEELRNDNHK